MKVLAVLILAVTAGFAAGQSPARAPTTAMAPTTATTTATAPAPGPAPAAGSLPIISFDSQKNTSLPLQTALCQRSLDFTYLAYTYTGNWSKVPNVQGASDNNYIFTYDLPPVGVSSNTMRIYMHQKLTPGLTVSDLIAAKLVGGVNSQGTLNSYEELVALARSVENKDNSYFAGVSTTTSAPALDVHILGLVIYGKSDADLGKKFIACCILNIVPNPSTTSVVNQSTATPAVAG